MKVISSTKGRSGKEELHEDYRNIISNPYFKNVLDSIPNIVAIINPNRQIIFSNQIMAETLKVLTVEDILGVRLGESIDCIHSDKADDGCGESENCDYCGANNAIRKSQKEKKVITDECRITAHVNGFDASYDFRVTVTPLEWNKKTYSIVSLNDISSEKRRSYLEKIFIHDVINKIGSLNCYLEMLKETKDTESKIDFLKGAMDLSHDITEDIIAQRELVAAESDSLQVSRIYLKTADIINAAVNQLKYHDVAKEKNIKIDAGTKNETILTDFALIKRVLTNLLKNALEAIQKQQTVTIGCDRINDGIIFMVHNPTFIIHEHELQIFQRSFSTKGNYRGLGTYSVKLLTEKYLGGKVNFSTNKQNGTVFRVILPTEILKSN